MEENDQANGWPQRAINPRDIKIKIFSDLAEWLSDDLQYFVSTFFPALAEFPTPAESLRMIRYYS